MLGEHKLNGHQQGSNKKLIQLIQALISENKRSQNISRSFVVKAFEIIS